MGTSCPGPAHPAGASPLRATALLRQRLGIHAARNGPCSQDLVLEEPVPGASIMQAFAAARDYRRTSGRAREILAEVGTAVDGRRAVAREDSPGTLIAEVDRFEEALERAEGWVAQRGRPPPWSPAAPFPPVRQTRQRPQRQASAHQLGLSGVPDPGCHVPTAERKGRSTLPPTLPRSPPPEPPRGRSARYREAV